MAHRLSMCLCVWQYPVLGGGVGGVAYTLSMCLCVWQYQGLGGGARGVAYRLSICLIVCLQMHLSSIQGWGVELGAWLTD